MDSENLKKYLLKKGVRLFCGVPDSLLQEFIRSIEVSTLEYKNIVTPNEGSAIALAMGSYMANKLPAVVYMQNSGLGNALNPLVSLADPEVYGVPMILIIGWRGMPGKKDEPQHVKQGRITRGQLDLLEIPYLILGSDELSDVSLDGLWEKMLTKSGPVAILVEEGGITNRDSIHGKKNQKQNIGLKKSLPTREESIEKVVNFCGDAFIVATTGKTGRELFEIRKKMNGEQRDLLVVGGMGHASIVALGVALSNESQDVICLDGDGALLMHQGSMTLIGSSKPKNYIHILLNNGTHDSVGGQQTDIEKINIGEIAKASNYRYFYIDSLSQIESQLNFCKENPGPHFLEIKLSAGSRENLGRPDNNPGKNKISCMKFLSENNLC